MDNLGDHPKSYTTVSFRSMSSIKCRIPGERAALAVVDQCSTAAKSSIVSVDFVCAMNS